MNINQSPKNRKFILWQVKILKNLDKREKKDVQISKANVNHNIWKTFANVKCENLLFNKLVISHQYADLSTQTQYCDIFHLWEMNNSVILFVD